MKRFANTLKIVILATIVALGLTHSAFGVNRGEIHSGETKIGLQITGPSYMDSWTFAGDVNDRVIITAVTTSDSLNTEIYLYPPGGGPVEAHTYPVGDKLDHQLQQFGLYTIVVQDYGLNNAGTYNISFLNLPDGPLSSPEDPNGGPIVSGETLSGSIVASDLDAFQFYGDVNDRVIITAVKTSGTLDTEIYLYPPDGGPVEAHTYPVGDKLDHQLQQFGLYTIVVQDYGLNNAGTYNISFLNLPDGPLSSPEDPDGGPIVSGETLSGSIVASDLDAFQFYGDVNDRVIITAVTTSGTLNTLIYLYPPDGGPVEAHTYPVGDKLDHQLQQFGLYTIVVQDYGLNNAGTYNISFLNLPDGPLSSPEDPNGGPIVSGETLSGSIVASDLDAFQFYGDVNDRVIITAVKTSGTLDTEIYLYPPDGGPAEDNTYPVGDRLSHQLQQSGLYTIVIQDYGLNNEGTYNISFLNLPDGPVSSANDPDGGPITSGETLSGTINVASDMDAFQFYGCVNDRVIITAVKTSGTLNTEIYLYPPDGGSAEDNTYPGGDRLDHQLQQSGLYTIVVQDYGLNDEGTYNISFLKTPATVPCLCLYTLVGDLNDDCRVNWLDFALMAENWLIDCNLTPGDPACIPK